MSNVSGTKLHSGIVDDSDDIRFVLNQQA